MESQIFVALFLIVFGLLPMFYFRFLMASKQITRDYAHGTIIRFSDPV